MAALVSEHMDMDDMNREDMDMDNMNMEHMDMNDIPLTSVAATTPVDISRSVLGGLV